MSSNEEFTDFRKKMGRPAGKIWEWFEKGAQVSRGYYSATCSFCEYNWATAKPLNLKKHLGYDCKKVDPDVRIKVLLLLLNEKADSDEEIESTSTTKHKRKQASQSENENYENFPTSLNKEIQINKSFGKIVCILQFTICSH